ncbi:MAG TPA: acyltransferase family protein [Pseudogracilibacillus sp.]|nr:acyltransferase family protein [Pseudogracilibacillus sp.]
MQRDSFYDNARVGLIFLVVFGHLLQPYTSLSTGSQALYTWIYTFHMPAFILISGFFARGSKQPKYVFNLIKKLLLPYIIFQLIYTGYYFLIDKPNYQKDLFDPQWSLWFLLSLFSWHLLLILFKKMPAFISISIAFAIGLLVGYFDDVGKAYSLSRTFAFFPFFLVGYFLTKEQLMQLKKPTIRTISLLIMAIIAVLIYFMPDFNSGWLLASQSYSHLGLPTTGAFARFLVYFTSSLMVIGFLSWVPSRKFSFTYIGERTLYIYLLHGFFIQYIRQTDLLPVTHQVHLIGIFVLAIVLVYILSHKYTVTIFKPLIEFEFSHLKRKNN